MGFGKSFKKSFKKVGKSFKKAFEKVSKVIKKVVSTAVDITVGIVSGEYLIKATGKILSFVGEEIVDDVFGLDDIGQEISNIGGDIEQVGKVLGGEYHDDVKKIQELEKKLEARIDKYNLGLDELYDRLDDLIAFHEIFQMALSNRIGDYKDQNEPVLQELIEKYEKAVRKLKDEYDFVIGLTQGAFIQRLVGSIIMIIGGLMSDIQDIADGRADSETWKRLITSVATIVSVILLLFVPGLQGVALVIAVTLASIAAFMTLDGMYANGAATGAIMGMLDFLFTDLLNLDDIIGSDFEKFDKDHEDYQEMVMYTKLALTLSSVAIAWSNSYGSVAGAESSVNSNSGFNFGTASKYGTDIGSEQTAMLAAQDAGISTNTSSFFGDSVVIGDSMSTSSLFGVKFSTYSDLYDAFTGAQSIKDVVTANEKYNEIKEKIKIDLEKVQSIVDSKYRKNFMKHYRDIAYFYNDQQEYIDRYIHGMTAENMYVDPYGTTPVANIRFSPDKDTRMMSFGFEDVFDESKQAGSKSYFNNILYG